MPIPSQTGIPYNKLATKSMVMDMRHKCNYKFCKNKKKKKKPIGIVINRDNGKFPLLETYLFENKLPVLMVLPEDLEIAKHYSTGNIILKTIPSYTEKFKELAVNIEKLLDTSKGRW